MKKTSGILIVVCILVLFTRCDNQEIAPREISLPNDIVISPADIGDLFHNVTVS
jgi:hypothetical protein